MKKVIKPSKQPTKKQSIQSQRSQRSQRSQQSQRSKRSKQTAKLKIAIGKIAAKLVKNHPKLVKGGGSSDITELIFSKNLMKGGEIGDDLRKDIVDFLIKFAPKVNDLKKELIFKIIRDIKDKKGSPQSMDSLKQIYDMFKGDVYKYENVFKDDGPIYMFYNAERGWGRATLEIPEDVQEDYTILEIVSKFYKLSKIKDDDNNIINKNMFPNLSKNIESAIDNKDMGALLKEYESKNDSREDAVENKEVVEEKKDEVKIPDNDAKYAQLVANADEVYEKNKGIVRIIGDSTKLKLVNNDSIYIYFEPVLDQELDAEKTQKLQELNALYYDLKDKESNIKTQMGLIEENIQTDDQITAVQKLIDEFNSSYKNIDDFYKIFDITINVTNLQDDDATRETSTELVVIEPKDDKSPKKDGGGNPTKYKSTGQVVNIMYKKKKYKRTIFVKDKRKTKYCKINNEYILLSKLNVL